MPRTDQISTDCLQAASNTMDMSHTTESEAVRDLHGVWLPMVEMLCLHTCTLSLSCLVPQFKSLLLFCAAHRYFYSIGTLQLQAAGSKVLPATTAAAPAAAPAANGLAAVLAQQSSWMWLLKRWLICHCDLLVGVACFSAAMQAPSAIGLTLLCGTLITGMQYNSGSVRPGRRRTSRGIASSRGPTSGGQQPSPQEWRTGGSRTPQQHSSIDVLMEGCVAVLQLLAAAWLIAQYVLQVGWDGQLSGTLVTPHPCSFAVWVNVHGHAR